jgi:hypothetical protein
MDTNGREPKNLTQSRKADFAPSPPLATSAKGAKERQFNPPTPSLRRDRPQMNQPAREAMAGKLQIYADSRR